MPAQNRRRFPRQRRRVKVVVEDKIFFTTDLAVGGLSAESMRVFPPGTQVKGRIIVGTEEFAFSGEIRWARQGDARVRELGRMGLVFRDMSPAFARAVEAASNGTGSGVLAPARSSAPRGPTQLSATGSKGRNST